MDVLESLFRWIHVVAGILWIGLLYFFNWVNSAFAPTMDSDTKRKVVPELMPRALYWFRWGAAFTWVTGVLLLMIVYYHGPYLFDAPFGWGVAPVILIALVFLSPFLYDWLWGSVLRDPVAGVVGGLVAAAVLLFLFQMLGGFSFRGYAIHLGATFGTIMAFNVWFRIWPAQRKIISAIARGETPDAEAAALAGTRSKHNTYMSVPLVFLMLSQHATWAAHPLILTAIVGAGWAIVYHLYAIAPKEGPRTY